VVDGEILPESPAEALAEGRDLPLPMIVGSALHEADFIFHEAPFNLDTVLRAVGPEGRRVYEAYGAERKGERPEEIAGAVLTDWVFGMPAVAFAEARAKSGHPTYVYQMRWGRGDGTGRATHGAENPFIFDRLEATGYSREAPDAAPLSKVMQQAWISFARTGNPSAEGAPWPAYAPPKREAMIFDRECHVERDFKRREREIWRV
jgi:para-nitrobenzyl esterase